MDMTVVLSAIGALVVLTNLITQVLKKVTWDLIPTNFLVVIISMVLTLAVFFTYCQLKMIAVAWYMIVGAVVLGFLVAYGAMFGFDKLREALAQIKRK